MSIAGSGSPLTSDMIRKHPLTYGISSYHDDPTTGRGIYIGDERQEERVEKF